MIFLLIFSLISQISLAQFAISDLKQIKNVPLYKGGEEAFYKHFGRLIKYPEQLRSSSDVYTVLGVIKTARNGKIVEIGTLNKVPKQIKDQFIRVAKTTNGDWEPTNMTSEFFYRIIPVEFSHAGVNYTSNTENKPKFFSESIIVKAYPSINSYEEDSKYLEKVNNSVFKGNYQEAVKMMEFLLSRQPYNQDYYKKIIDLNTILNKTEEVEYYTTLLDILANSS